MGKQTSIDAPPDARGELLERSRELSALTERLADVARSSRGRLVLLGGGAGAGKTALVRRFCAEHAPSARILWGACDPLFTPRPLGPVLDVAKSTGGELEELAQKGAHPHEVAAALMRELATRTPTILVLEDLHWADEATLDVLRIVGRRLDPLPALLVATYRNDELDRLHPLRVVLGEIGTVEKGVRLDLEQLSPEAVATLAEPYDVDPVELYAKTSGNPFFVTEVLAAGGGGIPDSIRDAVLARAARLSAKAATVLEAAAVLPPQAELWLLDALAPDSLEGLGECLTSGMLAEVSGAVEFRHELARLAVAESIPLNRSIGLHRKALEALAAPPAGGPDLARLAHHADAANDAEAVVRFAPAAAERAAALGAHREAAAQFARALRHGDRLPPEERAALLSRRAQECYLTDQNADAIEAVNATLEQYRSLGDPLREGDALRLASEILWCPGRVAESGRAAEGAVSVLEALPPGRELGLAYANLASFYNGGEQTDEALAWGARALELGRALGDDEIVVQALTAMGSAAGSLARLEEALALAMRAGLDSQAGRVYLHIVGFAVSERDHALADANLVAASEFCSERGQELSILYLLAHRARAALNRGRWTDAAEFASAVLRVPRASTTPRILALVVLALVRARRGDPEVSDLLDEAWALAEPSGELLRMGPAASARAEVAWLVHRRERTAEATESTYALAVERKSSRWIGELACWRRRAGIQEELPPGIPEPYALQIAGDWRRAEALWTKLDSPYEAMLALADADEEEPLRLALDELQRLEARPAAAIVARRLRTRGATGLPRGPRPATRRNPANLTARELEVLELIAEGLRNGEIASRLVVSKRTVDHHVAKILRKLDVRSRSQASAEAVRLGLAGQHR